MKQLQINFNFALLIKPLKVFAYEKRERERVSECKEGYCIKNFVKLFLFYFSVKKKKKDKLINNILFS